MGCGDYKVAATHLTKFVAVVVVAKTTPLDE